MSMEPDVVKIASTTLTPQKADVVDTKNKGKAIQLESPSDEELAGSASDGDDDAMDDNDDYYPESPPVSNSLLDPDSLINEDDDDYNDEYSYEMEEETDSYSIYQDLFDSKDLPTGVEVSMEWFPDSAENGSANPSGSNKQSSAKTGNTSDATGSSSQKPAKGGGIHSPFFSSDLPTPIAQPWKKVAPQNPGGVTPSSAYALPQNKSSPSPFTTNHLQPQTPDTLMGEAPVQATSSSSQPKYVPKYGRRAKVDELIAAPDPSRVKKNMEEYLRDFVFFKRFDIVEDSSDHHYASRGNTTKQHSKEWSKRIQEEWKILEKDLPEMIFVRAYESRMDLLRAVIIGAQGTPYHDGLFFFDIFFPDTYPSGPPTVHYHSGGLRINPNLYDCGKVCLSLLGTWTGTNREEKWIPNKSTMLQVLVSIQGLILNEKPYFNEPGYERTAGSLHGESHSKVYSEDTFMFNLKTMVYTMRRPPKYFENFVYGHFYGVAHDLLNACHAYRNGALVGAKVKRDGAKGKGDEAKEKGDEDEDVKAVDEKIECSSLKLRNDVATFVENTLLREFILLGVLGLEAEPEEEEKLAETNKVAESSISNGTKSSSKRDKNSSN